MPRERADHENIARLRDFPTLSKDLEHIPELPVDIAAHCHGRLDEVDVGFFEEDIADSGAEGFYLSFGEVFALSDLGKVEVSEKRPGRAWKSGVEERRIRMGDLEGSGTR